MRLAGKITLITGGESGIGLATAHRFVAEGAQVHIIGLDEGRLKDAVAELGAATSYAVADVTDEDAVRHAIELGTARLGPLDVLLSNAGISGALTPTTDYPSDIFARTLAVHITGAFHVIKHGLPLMNDGGSIIITSSVAGLMGFAGACAYVAAKHGQVGLMRTVATEVAPRRIRVNSLHPGPTSTAFQDEIEMAATGLPREQAAAAFDQLIPLGRHATVDEIAAAAVYLASDESAFLTRTTVALDGGMRG